MKFMEIWVFFKKIEMTFYLQRCENIKQLINFHSRYKLVIRVFSIGISRKLGRILAIYNNNFFETYQNYKNLVYKAFSLNPKYNQKIDAYFHLYGMVKESLNKDQRKELLDLIVNFRSSEIYDKLINDKFLDYLIYVNDEYKRNLISGFCLLYALPQICFQIQRNFVDNDLEKNESDKGQGLIMV